METREDSDVHAPFAPPLTVSGEHCGGHIGTEPCHFVVEEIPAYSLSGEGEHAFLWIEKTGITTAEVAKRLSRQSGIRDRDIGFAGMKDKVAVTRQWFSLAASDEDVASWDLGPEARILKHTRHKNKLRTGHLIGNRFKITLVDVKETALSRAQVIAAVLTRDGLPNYFGPQRFGRGGRNLSEALLWLEKQKLGGEDENESPSLESEKPAPRGKRRRKSRGKGARFDNKMMPSVIQSEIFNRYVAARLARSEELLLGEIVRLDNAAKCFIVQDVEAELPRRRERDLHLMGPMPGPKTLQAEADALALEEEVIRELGLSQEQMQILSENAPGARRDLALYPEALQVSAPNAGELVIEFSLPSGSYATQLVREFSGVPWDSPRG